MKKLCFFLLAVCLIGIACDEIKPEQISEAEKLQYAKTKLGGCNLHPPNDLRNVDSETVKDEVIITISKDSVNIFVGLNFTCKRDPFETEVEIIDDVIYMHITDTCDGYDEISNDCYLRCQCYYTFDFVFKYQGEINQAYKILLKDNLNQKPVAISEGVINYNGEILCIMGGDAGETCSESNIVSQELIWEINCPIEVSFTEYSLEETSCQWKNFDVINGYDNAVVIINSKEDLENYIECIDDIDYKEIDFSTYTLLLAHGTVPSSVVNVSCNNLQQFKEQSYKMEVEIIVGDATVMSNWQIPIIINKMREGCIIELIVTIKYHEL